MSTPSKTPVKPPKSTGISRQNSTSSISRQNSASSTFPSETTSSLHRTGSSTSVLSTQQRRTPSPVENKEEVEEIEGYGFAIDCGRAQITTLIHKGTEISSKINNITKDDLVEVIQSSGILSSIIKTIKSHGGIIRRDGSVYCLGENGQKLGVAFILRQPEQQAISQTPLYSQITKDERGRLNLIDPKAFGNNMMEAFKIAYRNRPSPTQTHSKSTKLSADKRNLSGTIQSRSMIGSVIRFGVTEKDSKDINNAILFFCREDGIISKESGVNIKCDNNIFSQEITGSAYNEMLSYIFPCSNGIIPEMQDMGYNAPRNRAVSAFTPIQESPASSPSAMQPIRNRASTYNPGSQFRPSQSAIEYLKKNPHFLKNFKKILNRYAEAFKELASEQVSERKEESEDKKSISEIAGNLRRLSEATGGRDKERAKKKLKDLSTRIAKSYAQFGLTIPSELIRASEIEMGDGNISGLQSSLSGIRRRHKLLKETIESKNQPTIEQKLAAAETAIQGKGNGTLDSIFQSAVNHAASIAKIKRQDVDAAYDEVTLQLTNQLNGSLTGDNRFKLSVALKQIKQCSNLRQKILDLKASITEQKQELETKNETEVERVKRAIIEKIQTHLLIRNLVVGTKDTNFAETMRTLLRSSNLQETYDQLVSKNSKIQDLSTRIRLSGIYDISTNIITLSDHERSQGIARDNIKSSLVTCIKSSDPLITIRPVLHLLGDLQNDYNIAEHIRTAIKGACRKKTDYEKAAEALQRKTEAHKKIEDFILLCKNIEESKSLEEIYNLRTEISKAFVNIPRLIEQATLSDDDIFKKYKILKPEQSRLVRENNDRDERASSGDILYIMEKCARGDYSFLATELGRIKPTLLEQVGSKVSGQNAKERSKKPRLILNTLHSHAINVSLEAAARSRNQFNIRAHKSVQATDKYITSIDTKSPEDDVKEKLEGHRGKLLLSQKTMMELTGTETKDDTISYILKLELTAGPIEQNSLSPRSPNRITSNTLLQANSASIDAIARTNQNLSLIEASLKAIEDKLREMESEKEKKIKADEERESRRKSDEEKKQKIDLLQKIIAETKKLKKSNTDIDDQIDEFGYLDSSRIRTELQNIDEKKGELFQEIETNISLRTRLENLVREYTERYNIPIPKSLSLEDLESRDDDSRVNFLALEEKKATNERDTEPAITDANKEIQKSEHPTTQERIIAELLDAYRREVENIINVSDNCVGLASRVVTIPTESGITDGFSRVIDLDKAMRISQGMMESNAEEESKDKKQNRRPKTARMTEDQLPKITSEEDESKENKSPKVSIVSRDVNFWIAESIRFIGTLQASLEDSKNAERIQEEVFQTNRAALSKAQKKLEEARERLAQRREIVRLTEELRKHNEELEEIYSEISQISQKEKGICDRFVEIGDIKISEEESSDEILEKFKRAEEITNSSEQIYQEYLDNREILNAKIEELYAKQNEAAGKADTLNKHIDTLEEAQLLPADQHVIAIADSVVDTMRDITLKICGTAALEDQKEIIGEASQILETSNERLKNIEESHQKNISLVNDIGNSLVLTLDMECEDILLSSAIYTALSIRAATIPKIVEAINVNNVAPDGIIALIDDLETKQSDIEKAIESNKEQQDQKQTYKTLLQETRADIHRRYHLPSGKATLKTVASNWKYGPLDYDKLGSFKDTEEQSRIASLLVRKSKPKRPSLIKAFSPRTEEEEKLEQEQKKVDVNFREIVESTEGVIPRITTLRKCALIFKGIDKEFTGEENTGIIDPILPTLPPAKEGINTALNSANELIKSKLEALRKKHKDNEAQKLVEIRLREMESKRKQDEELKALEDEVSALIEVIVLTGALQINTLRLGEASTKVLQSHDEFKQNKDSLEKKEREIKEASEQKVQDDTLATLKTAYNSVDTKSREAASYLTNICALQKIVADENISKKRSDTFTAQFQLLQATTELSAKSHKRDVARIRDDDPRLLAVLNSKLKERNLLKDEVTDFSDFYTQIITSTNLARGEASTQIAKAEGKNGTISLSKSVALTPQDEAKIQETQTNLLLIQRRAADIKTGIELRLRETSLVMDENLRRALEKNQYAQSRATESKQIADLAIGTLDFSANVPDNAQQIITEAGTKLDEVRNKKREAERLIDEIKEDKYVELQTAIQLAETFNQDAKSLDYKAVKYQRYDEKKDTKEEERTLSEGFSTADQEILTRNAKQAEIKIGEIRRLKAESNQAPDAIQITISSLENAIRIARDAIDRKRAQQAEEKKAAEEKQAETLLNEYKRALDAEHKSLSNIEALANLLNAASEALKTACDGIFRAHQNSSSESKEFTEAVNIIGGMSKIDADDDLATVKQKYDAIRNALQIFVTSNVSHANIEQQNDNANRQQVDAKLDRVQHLLGEIEREKAKLQTAKDQENAGEFKNIDADRKSQLKVPVTELETRVTQAARTSINAAQIQITRHDSGNINDDEKDQTTGKGVASCLAEISQQLQDTNIAPNIAVVRIVETERKVVDEKYNAETKRSDDELKLAIGDTNRLVIAVQEEDKKISDALGATFAAEAKAANNAIAAHTPIAERIAAAQAVCDAWTRKINDAKELLEAELESREEYYDNEKDEEENKGSKKTELESAALVCRATNQNITAFAAVQKGASTFVDGIRTIVIDVSAADTLLTDIDQKNDEESLVNNDNGSAAERMDFAIANSKRLIIRAEQELQLLTERIAREEEEKKASQESKLAIEDIYRQIDQIANNNESKRAVRYFIEISEDVITESKNFEAKDIQNRKVGDKKAGSLSDRNVLLNGNGDNQKYHDARSVRAKVEFLLSRMLLHDGKLDNREEGGNNEVILGYFKNIESAISSGNLNGSGNCDIGIFATTNGDEKEQVVNISQMYRYIEKQSEILTRLRTAALQLGVSQEDIKQKIIESFRSERVTINGESYTSNPRMLLKTLGEIPGNIDAVQYDQNQSAQPHETNISHLYACLNKARELYQKAEGRKAEAERIERERQEREEDENRRRLSISKLRDLEAESNRLHDGIAAEQNKIKNPIDLKSADSKHEDIYNETGRIIGLAGEDKDGSTGIIPNCNAIIARCNEANAYYLKKTGQKPTEADIKNIGLGLHQQKTAFGGVSDTVKRLFRSYESLTSQTNINESYFENLAADEKEFKKHKDYSDTEQRIVDIQALIDAANNKIQRGNTNPQFQSSDNIRIALQAITESFTNLGYPVPDNRVNANLTNADKIVATMRETLDKERAELLKRQRKITESILSIQAAIRKKNETKTKLDKASEEFNSILSENEFIKFLYDKHLINEVSSTKTLDTAQLGNHDVATPIDCLGLIDEKDIQDPENTICTLSDINHLVNRKQYYGTWNEQKLKDEILEQNSFQRLKIEDDILEGYSLNNSHFTNCAFEGVDFTKINWGKNGATPAFENCIFHKCTFPIFDRSKKEPLFSASCAFTKGSNKYEDKSDFIPNLQAERKDAAEQFVVIRVGEDFYLVNQKNPAITTIWNTSTALITAYNLAVGTDHKNSGNIDHVEQAPQALELLKNTIERFESVTKINREAVIKQLESSDAQYKSASTDDQKKEIIKRLILHALDPNAAATRTPAFTNYQAPSEIVQNIAINLKPSPSPANGSAQQFSAIIEAAKSAKKR